MRIEQLEVYADDVNYAVIKPPGRRFPGAVIQGDSLAILCRKVVMIAKSVRDGAAVGDDFRGELEDVVDSLVGRLLHYQAVLRMHNIKLPYGGAFTGDDLIRLLPPQQFDDDISALDDE
jgi:hypothetical protein